MAVTSKNKKSIIIRAALAVFLAANLGVLAERRTAAQDGGAGGAKLDVDLGKIRNELSRSRKDAESKPGHESFEGFVPVDDLDAQDQKLMEAESKLLNKLAQGESGVLPKKSADADPKTVEEPAAERFGAARKSSESDAGSGEKGPAPAAAAEDERIEVVRFDKPNQAVEPAAQAINDEEDLHQSEAALALNRAAEFEGKYQAQVKAAAALQRSNVQLKRQLDAAVRSSEELRKELTETRNRLIIAETQVERLSSIIEERNRSSLAKVAGNIAVVKPASGGAARVDAAPAQQEKMSDDMLIATVVAEKAYLRTAPGKENSPLMSVSKGTRLAIETRSGNWYRVIAPTGARAWVSTDVVAFGRTPQAAPSRTVKVRGYDSSIEDEASKLISRGR